MSHHSNVPIAPFQCANRPVGPGRDSAADPFNEADFELPDGKTMPERIRQFIAFSVSEMKLYKHATTHKWTADKLISTTHRNAQELPRSAPTVVQTLEAPRARGLHRTMRLFDR